MALLFTPWQETALPLIDTHGKTARTTNIKRAGMPTINTHKMTRDEKYAVTSLSTIMALRMMGLFMILPVFSLYATQLAGATPTTIGLALGIYGFTQALFQIPFGNLSDKLGRKPLIVAGLVIFILGSLIAGCAHSITLMIIGRALQGVGAVGSTILALIADLTRENQRTKAMAVAGITIGFSFTLAMVLGPVLAQWLAINQIFFVSALLGLCGLLVLPLVPAPTDTHWQRDTEPALTSFLTLLKHPGLARLNTGIFILHAIFTASFIVIPLTLKQAGFAAQQQWKIYLPALIAACVLSLIGIGFAERKRQIKPWFMAGITLLLVAEIVLWVSPQMTLSKLAIALFFTGFSLLEAFLPSLVSRTAPAASKGSALGIYSCAQFFGIFTGGVVGGWLYGQYHFSGVYLFCVILAVFWLLLAARNKLQVSPALSETSL